MVETLLLVDYENVPKVDLSVLDQGFRAIIFVGKHQQPPKASKQKANAHRFVRVDFLKIEGVGKNALDFHIAFHLGRTFETSPETECIVIAKDKGYDPLLAHLNKNGMKCRRVASWEQLVAEGAAEQATPPSSSVPIVITEASIFDPDLTVCLRCKKTSTIEHYGGRWCSNCGSFASPPDPQKLPSHEGNRGREAQSPALKLLARQRDFEMLPVCGWCHNKTDMTGGIYDDGEWMCADCLDGFASRTN